MPLDFAPAQHKEVPPADHTAKETSTPWQRELDLIRHMPEDVATGFVKRAQYANDHKVETAIEFGVALAVGATLAYTTKNINMFKLGAELTLGCGAAASAGSLAYTVLTPFDMAWKSDEGLEKARKFQSKYFGAMAFDAPILIAGGAVGMKGMAMRGLGPEMTGMSFLKQSPLNVANTAVPALFAVKGYDAITGTK